MEVFEFKVQSSMFKVRKRVECSNWNIEPRTFFAFAMEKLALILEVKKALLREKYLTATVDRSQN